MIKDKLFEGEDIRGEVGIEIEVEGEHLPMVDSRYWRTDHDGSLKAEEAYEYVLKQPVKREDVVKSLANLDALWKRNKAIIFDSFRAGVHVHVNVRDLTVSQMVTFAVLYYIFEDILLEWCGEDRVGNHFCLGSKDAEYVLFKLEQAIRDDNLASLYTDGIRYSSLNFKALLQYGSLEFRGMRSTADMGVIEEWVKILLALKDYAIKLDKPSAVIEEFSLKGTVVLANDIFKDTLLDIKPEWKESMYGGLHRVQSIAFCMDWDKNKKDVLHFPYDLDFDIERGDVGGDLDDPVKPFDLEAMRDWRVNPAEFMQAFAVGRGVDIVVEDDVAPPRPAERERHAGLVFGAGVMEVDAVGNKIN